MESPRPEPGSAREEADRQKRSKTKGTSSLRDARAAVTDRDRPEDEVTMILHPAA